MTDREDVQINVIDAIAAKQGIAGSMTPSIHSGLLQAFLDKTPLLDELSGSALATYDVNTLYAELGGYVVEVNSEGTHGIVVAMQDQGVSNWFEADNFLSDELNHDIIGANFKDWRLPTKRELTLIYDKYTNGGLMFSTTNYYWSSTVAAPGTVAYRLHFNYGNPISYDMHANGKIRAVRIF